MISEDTIFKFNEQDINPYEENTPAWHVYIDCSIASDESNNVLIQDMVNYNGLDVNYYACYLPILIQDKIVELLR